MIRVGIIRGGRSDYERSLESGGFLLRELPAGQYVPVDIYVDKDGVWHHRGIPLSHDRLREAIDMAVNVADSMHDQTLNLCGIPHVGNHALHSALCDDRALLVARLRKSGVRMPRAFSASWQSGGSEEVADVVRHAFKSFAPPWIVRPVSRSYGGNPIKCATRDELFAVLSGFAHHGIPVLVQEHIFGTEAFVVSLPGFRRNQSYTFMPVRVDSERARFSLEESAALQRVAVDAHQAIGSSPYLRIETVITKRGDVYVTEVHTRPEFHEKSALRRSLESVGASVGEFFEHLMGKKRPA